MTKMPEQKEEMHTALPELEEAVHSLLQENELLRAEREEMRKALGKIAMRDRFLGELAEPNAANCRSRS